MKIKTGNDVKIAVLKLGLANQSQLADQLGVTVRTVNKICNSDEVSKLHALAIEQLLVNHGV